MNEMETTTRLIYQPNDIGRPTFDQIRWEGVPGEDHVDEESYNNAQIIVTPSICFDSDQDCLRQIAQGIKKGPDKKGFDQDFNWHESGYTADKLIEHGFMMISTQAIFVVPDDAGKFVVKFVYEPISKGTIDDPLLALSEYIFTQDGRIRDLVGLSIVTERGNKNMGGSMGALGSWYGYGKATQGLGPGVKQVMAYKPKGKRDERAIQLYQAHADHLSSYENRLTPSCGKARKRLMMNFDPKGVHRISSSCMATAVSVTMSFVVTPHMDSGSQGALEFIKFLNTDGPLPEGHKWYFVVAGCILELPSKEGDIVLICLPGHGVWHGTLPTSSTEDTHFHRGVGSALISKGSVLSAKQTEPTPIEYCATTIYRVNHVSFLLYPWILELDPSHSYCFIISTVKKTKDISLQPRIKKKG